MMTENALQVQDRLAAFRTKIAEIGLDGFIVPRTDEYQSEFLAPYALRLEWLTGFTGSAGIAVILKDKAVVMSDGRYTIQLGKEVDPELFETAASTKASVGEWLSRKAEKGQRIGFDPRLHTPRQMDAIHKKMEGKAVLVAVSDNPVDAVWTNRPGKPMNPAELFPDEVAGSTSAQKRERIAALIREKGAEACLLTTTDSICWLLNVRGRDVLYTPVILSHAILYADGSLDWFLDPRKVPANLATHLGEQVRVFSHEQMAGHLAKFSGRKIMFDREKASLWFEKNLKDSGAELVEAPDPIERPKAVKSETEIEAVRQAHIRDAIAVIQLLHEIDMEAHKGRMTETGIDERIQMFRAQQFGYQGPSFATIAGYNENGAIIHYRAMPETGKQIVPPGLLLVDCGGQYMWGTTDITRTIAIGPPTPEMKKHYTLVLKGHVALSRAKFPEGATGIQLDTFARQHLWDAGLDFAHGTGHGVGCYLGVHEGPVSISPRCREKLEEGMLLTNEPGYYLEGSYGIRIENIMLVRLEKREEDGKKLFGFKTLTLVPYDQKLIDKELLTSDELSWLRGYYLDIEETIGPHLRPEMQKWLKKQTAFILE
ncbi:MAG: aminopeptidase P family protein [Alphaproteobacteria bacterium]|nr:aminopeptidase P family protein [Alphaproteobacteria bacterium]